jgi:hypothetical protein
VKLSLPTVGAPSSPTKNRLNGKALGLDAVEQTGEGELETAVQIGFGQLGGKFDGGGVLLDGQCGEPVPQFVEVRARGLALGTAPARLPVAMTVHVLDVLPVTKLGKVDKRRLRDQLPLP